jgi:hypothetical protein
VPQSSEQHHVYVLVYVVFRIRHSDLLCCSDFRGPEQSFAVFVDSDFRDVHACHRCYTSPRWIWDVSLPIEWPFSGERHSCACSHGQPSPYGGAYDHVPECTREAARAAVGQCSDVPPLNSTANASPIIHSPSAFKIQPTDAHSPLSPK